MSQAPQSFSWGRLIAETKMSGLTALVACHCEPTFYNANKPFLRLEFNEGLAALKESPAMDKLKSTLKGFFGESLDLEIVDGPALRSPAMLASSKKMASFQSAYETIMDDDFVNKMIKDFGAKVLTESVKSINPSGPKP